MYKILVDGNLFCSSEIEELAIINPVIQQEMNKAGTFTFTLPYNHPYYNTIQRRVSLIDVYRDEDTEPLFEGVCVSDTIDFYKQKKLTCEGELTFFNDSIQRPHRYEGLTSRQLLEAYVASHNLQVDSFKHFTVGQVTVHDSNDAIYCFTNYNSTMAEMKEDLIDDLGGFFRTRHENGVRYLDYLASSPRTNNQIIRLGDNLLDLSQNIDSESIATVIIPLGYTLDTQTIPGLDERLTIKSAAADSQHPSGADYVYSEDAVESLGWIEKVVTWDDVTTVAALLSKGKAYLSDIQFENLVITAKAVDLGLTTDEFNKFKLYDSIRVLSAPHGLDRYFPLSKITYNLNNPESDTITLGIEETKTLSAKTQEASAQIKREIEQLPTSNMVQSAIDNATALITGAEGGYVVIEKNAQGQPVEIKIQDALQNPTKIWRWNQNGFGYSSDGGQTYGTAITMNGAIVADFVTAGTMTAERIRGGELLLGGSGIAANAQITLKDSNNNTIGTLNRSGIDVKKGSIKGATIDVGGANNQDGAVYVSDANGNSIASLGKDGLFILDSNGNVMARLDHNGLYCSKGSLDGSSLYQFAGDNNSGYLSIDNGMVHGGYPSENTGRLSFIDSVGNNKVVALTSDHGLLINVETLWIGTHAQTVYKARHGGPFMFPTQLSSDGRVLAAQQGVYFVNGMLVN